MRKKVQIMLLQLSLLLPVSVRAQYYSVNYDAKTVAAMTAAFGTEAATEAYYAQQVAKIREHYQAAEVAAAGIFASKYLDRKALTHLGLWSSSTENYYYRRIYHLVSAKIMPKIWTVAGMMLKSPQNALYWGSYLYKVCDETKTLCYQFESIVTNSTLSFRDIAFLEVNQELVSLLKLSELGGTDWKAVLDNFGNIGENFTKENLQADLDNLYRMGVSLASAGAENLVGAILQGSNFSSTIYEQVGSVITVADNVATLYNDLNQNLGGTLLNFIGGEQGIANLFNLSNYNATAWLTDYAREGMGQYYTQRWYIYRVDQGSVSLCDYYPPTDDNSILYGDHWYRIDTRDPNFYPSSSQWEAILQNSENHAGWSRSRVQQLNNSHDGFTYSIRYYSSAYILSKSRSGQYGKAYAYEIHVTKSWYNREVKYEDVFDSYTMDLSTFMAVLNARLAEGGTPKMDMRRVLDLVALGTLADLVELEGQNRILVKNGLLVLAEAKRPGISELKAVSGFAPLATLGAGQVVFSLAPRINAAGRIASGDDSLSLILSETRDEAAGRALKVDMCNLERKAVEQKMLDSALGQVRPGAGAQVIDLPDGHQGVAGIVAARVMERLEEKTKGRERILNIALRRPRLRALPRRHQRPRRARAL